MVKEKVSFEKMCASNIRMKELNFTYLQVKDSCFACANLKECGGGGYHGFLCKTIGLFFFPNKLGASRCFICNSFERRQGSIGWEKDEFTFTDDYSEGLQSSIG